MATLRFLRAIRISSRAPAVPDGVEWGDHDALASVGDVDAEACRAVSSGLRMVAGINGPSVSTRDFGVARLKRDNSPRR